MFPDTRQGSLRATLAVAALVFAGFLTLSAGAESASARQIVIHGAHSGSTLYLKTAHKGLVVRGYMARSRPRGCRWVRYRMKVRCPFRHRGIRSIKVEMGPSGDWVEVKERLPVPLFVYLGKGRDKFIGNGERDICYPQGSRRNRCIGGPNHDVCITGPRNSDCVGGPGNDYCKTSTGSDGCWGGRGRDICIMGPGHDGCHGNQGSDQLYGGTASDRLYGGPGNDYCNGGPQRGKSRTCERGPRR